MNTSNNKEEIKYGEVDVLPLDEFDPKNVKVRISIFLDGDVLDACKAAAKEKGMKYQTLINQTLRHVFIEKAIEETLEIKVRLDELESKFYSFTEMMTKALLEERAKTKKAKSKASMRSAYLAATRVKKSKQRRKVA